MEIARPMNSNALTASVLMQRWHVTGKMVKKMKNS